MARRTTGDKVRRISKTFLASVSPHNRVIYRIIRVNTGIFDSVVIGECTVGYDTVRVIHTTGVGPTVSTGVIIEHAVGDRTSSTHRNRTITTFATANDTILYGCTFTMDSTCRTGGSTQLYKTIADDHRQIQIHAILFRIDSSSRLRVTVADNTIVEGHITTHIRCTTGRSVL